MTATVDTTAPVLSTEEMIARTKALAGIESPVTKMAQAYKTNMIKSIAIGGATGLAVGLFDGFSKTDTFGPDEYVNLAACTFSGISTGYITASEGISAGVALPMSFLTATASLKIADIILGYADRFGLLAEEEVEELVGELEIEV